MKFKNKETGAIFDYKNYLFCGQYDGYCPNCPIFSRLEGLATGRVSDRCDKWVSSHLKEAAELMGYEVIDEGDALEPTHHQKAYFRRQKSACVVIERGNIEDQRTILRPSLLCGPVFFTQRA